MLITTSVHDLCTALVYGMCIAVFVCTDTYILYYRVTIAHDATSTGSGDSSPGNGDMKTPFEEDMTGDGNNCDNILFEGKCTHMYTCTRLYSPSPYIHVSVNTYPYKC